MRLILVLISILACTTLYAQKPGIKVPDAIAKVVKDKYPTATELEWQEKKGRYKAEFKVGKDDHKMWIEQDGAVAKHEYEIKKAELPQAINDAVAKEFSGYTIGDCEQSDEKGASTFKVELKSPQGKKKVDFTSEGKVIPKKE